MRAYEFITEASKNKDASRVNGNTKISPDSQNTTVGLHVLSNAPNDMNRLYNLNRVMMAAACTDGETDVTIPEHSWASAYNTAHPYTEVEQKKLLKAYKAAGAYHKDLNKGDLRSQEPDSTNKSSPLKPFKGYKK